MSGMGLSARYLGENLAFFGHRSPRVLHAVAIPHIRSSTYPLLEANDLEMFEQAYAPTTQVIFTPPAAGVQILLTDIQLPSDDYYVLQIQGVRPAMWRAANNNGGGQKADDAVHPPAAEIIFKVRPA